MKQNIVSMTKGEDKWKLDNLSTNLTNKGPQEEMAYLTVLNEVQEYIDRRNSNN